MATGEAVLIGPVRQELLSGVRSTTQFTMLQNELDGFTLLPLAVGTYDLAATFFNACRSKGVTPGDVDMTVRAAAVEDRVVILTRDSDFERYAKMIPIRIA
jgi:predicted nucleic acid-binding protein